MASVDDFRWFTIDITVGLKKGDVSDKVMRIYNQPWIFIGSRKSVLVISVFVYDHL